MSSSRSQIIVEEVLLLQALIIFILMRMELHIYLELLNERARIQESHILVGHIICQLIEEELF